MRRPRLQFSMRWAMVAIALVAVALGAWIGGARAARRREFARQQARYHAKKEAYFRQYARLVKDWRDQPAPPRGFDTGRPESRPEFYESQADWHARKRRKFEGRD